MRNWKKTEPAQAEERTEKGWVALHEAAQAAGVSVSTLKQWCRDGEVPSKTERRPQGAERRVPLGAVLQRAGWPRTGPLPVPDGHAGSSTDQPAVVLVPRDAWESVVAQLSQLHAMGLQLADARERAAKAEAEAASLREQLAARRPHAHGTPADPALRDRVDDAVSRVHLGWRRWWVANRPGGSRPRHA